MVTMMTLMIGSPTMRRRNTRSISMPSANVASMASRPASQKFMPDWVRAKAMNAPVAITCPWAKLMTRLDL